MFHTQWDLAHAVKGSEPKSNDIIRCPGEKHQGATILLRALRVKLSALGLVVLGYLRIYLICWAGASQG